MKISDMDEREYNRFNNLNGQAEKAYGNRENSFRTEAGYKQGMEQFTKYLATETKINSIQNFKAKHVINFAEQMRAEGLSASTQKTYLSAIRNFADRIGMDQRNIPSNQRLEVDKRNFGNVDRSWTEKEYKDFKEVAKDYDNNKGQGDRIQLILDTARYFGCRTEGVLGLDLNAINKAINLGELHTKEKNGKINVKPVETPQQKELLEKIKQLGEENGKNKIFIDGDFKRTYSEIQNFINNNSGKLQLEERMNNAEARKSFEEDGTIRKGNLTMHGLRHTYAKEMVNKYMEQGDSLEKACSKVSKLLGHNRKEVTKIYLASVE